MEYLLTEAGRYIAYADGGLSAAIDIARMVGEKIVESGLPTMLSLLGL